MSRPALKPLFHGRRRRSALGAIAAVAVAIGAIIGGGEPASSQGASNSKSGGSGVATVQRRDLIATDTEAGTLGYADPQTVFNRISGTITSLPSVGTTIKPGGILYHVDGAPVVLLDGTLPAYRTLAAGITDGADVAELKQNLIKLGFDPGHAITVNNTFDSATTSGVDRWQASLGETQTGSITLGQVVFLSGPRRIRTVDGVLGSTGGASSATGGSTGGSSGAAGSSSATGTTTGASATSSPTANAAPASYAPDGPPPPEFVSLTTPTRSNSPTSSTAPDLASSCPPTTPKTTTTTTTAPSTRNPAPCPAGKSGPTASQLLAQLVAALKRLAANGSPSGGAGKPGSSTTGSSPSASGSGAGRSSGGGGAASAGAGTAGAATAGASAASTAGGSAAATQIMQTTSADLVVTVQLDATKQSEAVIGAPVAVQLPDGTADNGRITGVSSVAQSTASSSTSGGAATGTPSATVPVTVTLTGRRHVIGLDQAAVSVNFEQQVKRGVLSVPVTALLATAGGGYAVQTVGPGPRQLLAVTPGLFAGGYVEVSGSSLSEGMQVSDSQG